VVNKDDSIAFFHDAHEISVSHEDNSVSSDNPFAR